MHKHGVLCSRAYNATVYIMQQHCSDLRAQLLLMLELATISITRDYSPLIFTLPGANAGTLLDPGPSAGMY